MADEQMTLNKQLDAIMEKWSIAQQVPTVTAHGNILGWYRADVPRLVATVRDLEATVEKMIRDMRMADWHRTAKTLEWKLAKATRILAGEEGKQETSE